MSADPGVEIQYQAIQRYGAGIMTRQVLAWQRAYNMRLSFSIDYLLTAPTTAQIEALYRRLEPWGA